MWTPSASATLGDGGTLSLSPCSSPVGSYCLNGVSQVCPAGRYGSTENSTDPTCDGPCDASEGSYCAAGATSATGQLCPAGRFGNVTHLSSPSCSGPCPAGYWCPMGSTRPNARPCGNFSVYCPTGSAAPHLVPNGSLSTPVDADYDVRTGVTVCVPGLYCVDGVAQVCPAGWYGAASNATACDGMCEAGFFCSMGSSSSREYPCPAGRYGATPGLTSPYCSGPCPAGYLCPRVGTSDPFATPCGDASVYCPAGSTAPQPVPLGLYSTPISSDPAHRSGVAGCPAGSYCVHGVAFLCSAGRFGFRVNSSDALCDGKCTVGHYCPAGASSEVACPVGRFGSQQGLTNSSCTGACPSGTYSNGSAEACTPCSDPGTPVGVPGCPLTQPVLSPASGSSDWNGGVLIGVLTATFSVLSMTVGVLVVRRYRRRPIPPSPAQQPAPRATGALPYPTSGAYVLHCAT
jgi:hypothetical protein